MYVCMYVYEKVLNSFTLFPRARQVRIRNLNHLLYVARLRILSLLFPPRPSVRLCVRDCGKGCPPSHPHQ